MKTKFLLKKFTEANKSNCKFKNNWLDKKVLTMDTINQNLIKAKYEVRGGIVLKAEELKKEMDHGKKMPFNDFVYWNIGNPQSLGQLPISFSREVNFN